MSEEKKELKPIVKFAINISKVLKFQYDSGKKIEPKGETWPDGKAKEPTYLYGVVVEGVESVLFATKKLNELIEELKPKDKSISITKVQEEGVKYSTWDLKVVDAPVVEPVKTEETVEPKADIF